MKIDWQIRYVKNESVLVVSLMTTDEDAEFSFSRITSKMREVGMDHVSISGSSEVWHKILK